MPAKFRETLGDGAALVIVPDIEDLCLEVYPIDEWQKLGERFQELPRFSAIGRDAGRLYFSRAREVSLDSAGRILLPPDLREQAGLGKDVMLVGPGFAYFEVWDRGRFDAYDRSNTVRRQEIRDGLADKGV